MESTVPFQTSVDVALVQQAKKAFLSSCLQTQPSRQRDRSSNVDSPWQMIKIRSTDREMPGFDDSRLDVDGRHPVTDLAADRVQPALPGSRGRLALHSLRDNRASHRHIIPLPRLSTQPKLSMLTCQTAAGSYTVQICLHTRYPHDEGTVL